MRSSTFVFAGAGCAVAAATVWLMVWIVGEVERDVKDCHRRGGHLETVAIISTGKATVPIRECKGARP